MTHRYSLEAVDCTLHDLRRSTLPFDGIVLLCFGDFWQILLVVRAPNCSQKVGVFFKCSWLYILLKCLHILENVRLQVLHKSPKAARDALDFPCYLLNIGEGQLHSVETQTINLFTSVNLVKDSNDLIDMVLPNLQLMFYSEDCIAQRAVHTTRSNRLQNVNDGIKSMFSGTP